MKCLPLALTLLLAVPLCAQAPPPPLDPALGLTTIPLYDTPPPGPAADLPTLTVFPPQSGHSRNTAVIVAPGGAYLGLASNLEGRQVADWFATRGITAFVLKYRLGPNHLYPIPLEDAQRAIQLVRASASQYDIAPDRMSASSASPPAAISPPPPPPSSTQLPPLPQAPRRQRSPTGPTSSSSATPGSTPWSPSRGKRSPTAP